ncbi:MAG: hypothetical protein ABOJ95_000744 [Wolbachia endosymbiont of Armadillidium vulgare]|uniref:hypothetical protein n=1 Tax=Wolbachia endosymbiont of Armadillidium vulgare TaxID=77039 RepID=UPI0015D05E6A|nr:hypothetical protein [Wolbachia endosymbiont of Armadillidium vulgare]
MKNWIPVSGHWDDILLVEIALKLQCSCSCMPGHWDDTLLVDSNHNVRIVV